MLKVLFASVCVLQLATSHWMCDLAGSPCDGVGTGQETIPSGEFEGEYVKDVIVSDYKKEILCAMACQKINCIAYLSLEGKY